MNEDEFKINTSPWSRRAVPVWRRVVYKLMDILAMTLVVAILLTGAGAFVLLIWHALSGAPASALDILAGVYVILLVQSIMQD